jgi:hypothetical protein
MVYTNYFSQASRPLASSNSRGGPSPASAGAGGSPVNNSGQPKEERYMSGMYNKPMTVRESSDVSAMKRLT